MKTVKLLLLLPIVLLMLTPAHATPPTLLTGTIKALTAVRTETRTADGNTFVSATVTDVFAGGMEGKVVVTAVFVFISTGQYTIRADGNFTGIVNGNGPGAASIHATQQGTWNLSNGVLVQAQGQFVIGNGTGGLAGIHGEATFEGTTAAGRLTALTYSVLMHFDPA